jgi:hypothetical protein
MSAYPQADDEFVRRVERYMNMHHKGYENRVSRHMLNFVLRTNDRKIRDALSQIPGVCQQDKGYFIPTSREEALPYMNTLRSYIKSFRERLVALEGYLATVQEPQKAEQLTLEGVER